MSDFSHIGSDGAAKMVDTSEKQVSRRVAVAQSRVLLPAAVLAKIENGQIKSPKGAVFEVARLAGIMAVKRTGELIPLCHPIGLDHCELDIRLELPSEVVITCTCIVTAKTGVEMEALVGASMAALTIYDMCKALSHDIIITETKLLEKSGGKSTFKRA